MADRTLTFSLPNTSATTTWKRTKIYQNGTYVDTLTGTPTTGTGGTTVQITGLNLTGEERIKKAVVTSSYSISGTPTNGSFSMNGSAYTTAKKIDHSEIEDNTVFRLSFAFKADGNSGVVSGGGGTIAEFSCTRTVTNIELTITIGTGNAFDGKISSLNDGDKIVLTEANGTGTYTLVHHNYNTDKALFFRDDSVGTNKFNNANTTAYNNGYDKSALNNYIVNTWYPTLPADTTRFLTTIDYPVKETGLGNSAAITINRTAATLSARESGLGGSDGYGEPLDYTQTLSYGGTKNYWTREPLSGTDNYSRAITPSGTLTTGTVGSALAVRPTIGVPEEQLVKYSEDNGGYIFCTKCTAPTTVKINNDTTDITNAQSNTSCTLSWSGAAAGTNAPITGYAVWYSTSANGTYNLYGTTESTSMAVIGPEKGFSTYYFKVQTISEEEIDYCNSDLSSTSRAISTKNSNLYYYDGARWLIGLPKYWNGSAWVEGNSTNYYNGSSWKKPI